MTMHDRIIKEISECRTQQALDTVFSKHGITTIPQKRKYLKKVTGEISTRYYDGTPPEDAQYLDDVFMFLQGDWRYLQASHTSPHER